MGGHDVARVARLPNGVAHRGGELRARRAPARSEECQGAAAEARSWAAHLESRGRARALPPSPGTQRGCERPDCPIYLSATATRCADEGRGPLGPAEALELGGGPGHRLVDGLPL